MDNVNVNKRKKISEEPKIPVIPTFPLLNDSPEILKSIQQFSGHTAATWANKGYRGNICFPTRDTYSEAAIDNTRCQEYASYENGCCLVKDEDFLKNLYVISRHLRSFEDVPPVFKDIVKWANQRFKDDDDHDDNNYYYPFSSVSLRDSNYNNILIGLINCIDPISDMYGQNLVVRVPEGIYPVFKSRQWFLYYQQDLEIARYIKEHGSRHVVNEFIRDTMVEPQPFSFAHYDISSDGNVPDRNGIDTGGIADMIKDPRFGYNRKAIVNYNVKGYFRQGKTLTGVLNDILNAACNCEHLDDMRITFELYNNAPVLPGYVSILPPLPTVELLDILEGGDYHGWKDNVYSYFSIFSNEIKGYVVDVSLTKMNSSRTSFEIHVRKETPGNS